MAMVKGDGIAVLRGGSMWNLLALAISVLALLIAIWALWKAHKVKKHHDEQMADTLVSILDEWEQENRRFMKELEEVQQQLLQRLRASESSSIVGPVSVPAEMHTVVSEPEKPTAPSPPSTFQKLLEEVLAMKKEGKSEAEIARQMNRGIGEIRFILQSAAFQKQKRT